MPIIQIFKNPLTRFAKVTAGDWLVPKPELLNWHDVGTRGEMGSPSSSPLCIRKLEGIFDGPVAWRFCWPLMSRDPGACATFPNTRDSPSPYFNSSPLKSTGIPIPHFAINGPERSHNSFFQKLLSAVLKREVVSKRDFFFSLLYMVHVVPEQVGLASGRKGWWWDPEKFL